MIHAACLAQLVRHLWQLTSGCHDIDLPLNHLGQELGLNARTSRADQLPLLLGAQHCLSRRDVGLVHQNLEQRLKQRVINHTALLIHHLKTQAHITANLHRLD